MTTQENNVIGVALLICGISMSAFATEFFFVDEHAVALWDFQAVKNDKIPDNSGFENDGVLSVLENGQKPAQTADGLVFDGQGGYVQIEKKGSLNILKGDFSIEIIFKLGEKSQEKFVDMMFMGNKAWSSKTGGFYLSYLVWKKKSLIFNYCNNGAPVDFSADLPSALLPEKWYYLAVTLEGGKLNIWLDGETIASKENAAGISLSSKTPFRIGIYPLPWQRDANGKLKDKKAFEGTIKAIRISDCARDVSSVYKTIQEKIK